METKLPLNERLKFIVEYLRMNPTVFARGAEIEKGTFNRVINGHSIPRFDFIEKIYLTYPQINPHYLLTGEGPAFSRPEEGIEATLQACREKVAHLENEKRLMAELIDLYKSK